MSVPTAAPKLMLLSQHKPLSRSYQYRKVMKPMLERKRRARINKCLDDLKQLIIDAAQMDTDSLSKLEKADILELTVQQLKQLHQTPPSHDAAAAVGDASSQFTKHEYWAGFQHCAHEVSQFLGQNQPSNILGVQLVQLINLLPQMLQHQNQQQPLQGKCRTFVGKFLEERVDRFKNQSVWRPW